eukprot:305380-Prorocentrum_minimum.AAC.2
MIPHLRLLEPLELQPERRVRPQSDRRPPLIFGHIRPRQRHGGEGALLSSPLRHRGGGESPQRAAASRVVARPPGPPQVGGVQVRLVGVEESAPIGSQSGVNREHVLAA